jgi:hypothetical protein
MNPYQEAEMAKQRQQKQTFLKTEIIEKGYDGGQFGEYLNSVRSGGMHLYFKYGIFTTILCYLHRLTSFL